MNIDETTLIEIQDYINALDEKVGLKPETMADVRNAISKHKSELKNLRLGDVVGRSEQLPCEHERTRAGHHPDQPHWPARKRFLIPTPRATYAMRQSSTPSLSTRANPLIIVHQLHDREVLVRQSRRQSGLNQLSPNPKSAFLRRFLGVSDCPIALPIPYPPPLSRSCL